MTFWLNLLTDLFLLANLWAYFPQLWEPWFAPLLLIPGALFSWYWARKKGVWWVDLGFQILWPLALRGLLFLLWFWQSGSEPSPVDPLFFWFDKNFWPLYPLTVLFSLGSGLPLRFPGFRPWRVLIQGLLLVALFIPQGNFQNGTFSHPLLKALALTGFIIFQLVLLARSGGLKNKPKRTETTEVPVKKPRSLSSKIRTWGPLALLLLPLLAGVLWVLLTRYEQASVASGGGLMKPDLFRFDFSQFITLESEISMSDDLVMLYRREGYPTQQYVRRFILSGYTPQKGFFVAPPIPGGEEDIPPVGTKILNLPAPAGPQRQEETQEYYIVNFDPTSLLGLNAPVKIIPFEKWDQSSFVGSYQVISQVPAKAAWDLMDEKDSTLDTKLRAHYTDYGDNKAIADLAAQVTKSSPTYFDKVWDTLFYLKSNYYYSLKPGLAVNGNQLDHFLFESKKGYCSYFAFSMALMLRSQNIPARVAVGFFIDPSETMLNFYPVRANQAHAWVEVWFDQVGWIEFDPTSEELAPGEEFDPPRGLEVDKFSKLIQEILNHTLRTPTQTEAPTEALDTPWYSTAWSEVQKWWILWVPLVYSLFILGIYAGKILSPLRFSRSPRKRTLWLYRRGLDYLRLEGHHRLFQQSPLEFAHHLQDSQWDTITEVYLKSLYAENFTENDWEEAKKAFLKGTVQWKARTPRVRKILHGVFPWTYFKGGDHGAR